MPASMIEAPGNALIDLLAPVDRQRLLDQCESTELHFGAVLCFVDAPYEFAYFPRTGFVSLLASVDKRPPLEMGLVGNEGMLGATLALGVDAAPLLCVVQGGGNAWRIPVAALRELLLSCPALHAAVDRYVYVLIAQLAQSAACAHFHEVEPRLARWLLMTHDRAHNDRFHLTHQYLANMLGVQRSAVTIAAGALQKRRLIHYRRGEIEILSRSGLLATSCECFAAGVQDYEQQFPRIHAAPGIASGS